MMRIHFLLAVLLVAAPARLLADPPKPAAAESDDEPETETDDEPPPPKPVPKPEPPKPDPTYVARAEYRERRIGFNRGALGDGSHWGNPYLGSSDNPLTLDQFYEAVGRPDYARSYRVQTKKKLNIVVPSLVALVAGAALAVAGGVLGVAHPFCRAQDHYATCIDSDTTPNGPLLGVGLTLFVGGAVGVGLGSRIHRFPTGLTENYRMAREHNRQLRRRLGLPNNSERIVPNDDDLEPIPVPVPVEPYPARLGPQNL